MHGFIAELQCEKTSLEETITQLKAEHEEAVTKMQEENQEALENLQEALNKQKEEEYNAGGTLDKKKVF